MAKKEKKVKVIKSSVSSVAKAPVRANVAKEDRFFFAKKNYLIMIVGIILIALGLALMVGGQMPNEDIWDDNIIYSTRITVIAPLVILSGLALQIVAIFKK